jgi:hypothetical protein
MPVRTTATGWKRIIWKPTVIAVIMLIYAGGITIAYVRASHAITCINNSLGERGPKGRAYDQAVADAFTVIYERGKGVLSKSAAQVRFFKDAATVEQVGAYRNSHPLGRC